MLHLLQNANGFTYFTVAGIIFLIELIGTFIFEPTIFKDLGGDAIVLMLFTSWLWIGAIPVILLILLGTGAIKFIGKPLLKWRLNLQYKNEKTKNSKQLPAPDPYEQYGIEVVNEIIKESTLS